MPFVGQRLIGNWFAFRNADSKHAVNTLSTFLYMTCLLEDFTDTSASWHTVNREDVVCIYTHRETARIGGDEHVRVLLDDNIALYEHNSLLDRSINIMRANLIILSKIKD